MGKKKRAVVPPLYKTRIAACRRAMKKSRISAFLVSSRTDGNYLTGFTGEDSAILITPKAVNVISDGRFDEAINQECPWVTRWMRKITLNQEIASVCRQLKIKSLAVQPGIMTLASVAEWKKHNKSIRVVHAPPIVARLRIVKDDSELKAIRKSIRVAEESFLAMRDSIRIGQSEVEMAARLEYEMQRRGSAGVAFPSIVAEGPNAALPHAYPGKRKVKKGSAILFDWGAKLDGYCSDLTRLVFVGSIPRKIGEIYNVTLEAQRRAIVAVKPGKRMCDVDAAARDYIKEAGYGEAFNHGLGHGFGLDIHEAPRVSWQSKDKLEAGSVITIEPGIYLGGIGGVRIEDDLLVTAKGHRVLTRLGKSLEESVIKAR